MRKDEIIVELLKKGFIVELGEENFIISNKLLRSGDSESPVEETKKAIELKSPEDLLKQFIRDSRIPFRAKGPSGGHYQLAAMSAYSKKYFYNVMQTKKYKYEDMTSATSAYYNNGSMARMILTNYFQQGVFDQVMEEYLKAKEAGSLAPASALSNTPKSNSISL